MAEQDLLTYIRILNRRRNFLVGFIGFVAAASVIVSFLLPKWYAARSTLIPPQNSSDMSSALMSLVQGINIPGIGSPAVAGSESQLFLAILDSRTLREDLINRFGLMAVYRAKNIDEALRQHSQLARAGLTDEGVVEVVVEDRDPKRAADMANAWVEALDSFNKSSRMTAGRKSRLFVEARLADTREQLKAAEESLAACQQAHKSLPLTSDRSAAVETGASLMAQRIALQIELSMAGEIYRDGAPRLEQVRDRLAALDRQIGALPPMALEFARLLRNVKIQEQVHALLTSQYEEARIRENRDTPTLEVLDRATPPFRRVRPIRWLFCTSLTLAAAVVAVGSVFLAEYGRQLRQALAEPGPGHDGPASR